jgi:tripartite-type tricarboxylate transporter receptor subunit TctC
MMWSARFVAVLALHAILTRSVLGAAPEYPNRPMRYIVATGPGGASDLLARTIGPPLSERLGVQIVIDNRPGAGNTVGAEIAARAVPDGHTLFSCNIASLAVSPALYRKLGYDPERDFAPIAMIASNANVLTVHPSVPAATLAQFIELAKARPGKLNYASAGVGTSPQLSMELLRMQAGISIAHVPYKGVGPALVDLIGGRVEAMVSTVPAALVSVRGGKIRALGVTSTQRDPDLPDVPTIAESGMPDFEVISWQALCTPAGLPKFALDRLRTALAAVLALPDTAKRITDQGFHIHPMTADQFEVFVRAQRAKWSKAVKDIGIEPR